MCNGIYIQTGIKPEDGGHNGKRAYYIKNGDQETIDNGSFIWWEIEE